MVTYYVLYDTDLKMFARAGRSLCLTTLMNDAKHFTSQWCAENYKKKSPLFAECIIKKIQRY